LEREGGIDLRGTQTRERPKTGKSSALIHDNCLRGGNKKAHYKGRKNQKAKTSKKEDGHEKSDPNEKFHKSERKTQSKLCGKLRLGKKFLKRKKGEPPLLEGRTREKKGNKK